MLWPYGYGLGNTLSQRYGLYSHGLGNSLAQFYLAPSQARVYTHADTYAYTHVYTHAHTHAHTHAYMHVYAQAFMDVYTQPYMHVCTQAYMHAYTHDFIYACIDACLCSQVQAGCRLPPRHVFSRTRLRSSPKTKHIQLGPSPRTP